MLKTLPEVSKAKKQWAGFSIRIIFLHIRATSCGADNSHR